MVAPWLEVGFRATIVDIEHPAGEHADGPLTRVGADLTTWRPEKHYDIVFAFPPCTHLANSGARWFQTKGLKGLIEGLALVEACREIAETSGAPWMLENPIGTISTYWRKPDHYFDPCDFGGYLLEEGDGYTKRTCLWTGNGFRFPVKKPVEPIEGSKMHLISPGPDRGYLRSITPAGFARAVFETNVVLLDELRRKAG